MLRFLLDFFYFMETIKMRFFSDSNFVYLKKKSEIYCFLIQNFSSHNIKKIKYFKYFKIYPRKMENLEFKVFFFSSQAFSVIFSSKRKNLNYFIH